MTALAEKTADAPPQNLDAEESVLGVMLGAGAIGKSRDDVLDLLEARFFYREQHGVIFDAIRRTIAAGKNPEPLIVADTLERDGGLLEKAGGRTRLHELAALTPASANAKHYAELVRDAYQRRRVVLFGLRAQEFVREGATGPEALAAIEGAVTNLQAELAGRDGTVFTGLELAQWFDAQVQDPPDESVGIKTPFSFQPRMQRQRLYLLGGYTADGKTAAAMQHVKAAALEHRVGLVTLEMSKEDLTDRLVTSFGVPYSQAQKKRIQQPFRERLNEALTFMAAAKLDVIDDVGLDVAGIRRYQRFGKYDLLVVDHLHQVDWKERRDLEREIQALTNLAKELNCAVLGLVQLKRSNGTEPYPRPSLSSIRESGMFEMLASKVEFIWRHRDEHHLPKPEAEWIVAKNRFGPIGKKDLRFNEDMVRFEEPAP